jgi:hypothetical protein
VSNNLRDPGDNFPIGTERTTTMLRANAVSLLLAVLILPLFLLAYVILWDRASLQRVLDSLVSPFLLVIAISIFAHELLHGLGFKWGGNVPWSEIQFGVKGFTVYAHCRVPLKTSAYRFAVFLPGLVLGFLPGLIGLALGSAWLTVYGVLMIIAALGDVVVLWLIRSVPSGMRVRDHPDLPGCQVLPWDDP